MAPIIGITSSVINNSYGQPIVQLNQAYADAIAIAGGVLQVGDGHTTGTLGTNASVVNNSSLVVSRSDSLFRINGLHAAYLSTDPTPTAR